MLLFIGSSLSNSSYRREREYTAHCHYECAFESLKHRIFTLLSARSDDTNTILYGLVITALFFIGTWSIIYHWQCSWGLMMHNSVRVVWRAAPAEGIWKVIRAINPKFFRRCLSRCTAAASSYDGSSLSPPKHTHTQPPAPLSLLSVSRQKNNTTCLSCQLIRWNLIAQPRKFKAGNCS